MNFECECSGDRHSLNITEEEYKYRKSLRSCQTFICNSDCPNAIEEVQNGDYVKIFDNGKYMVQIYSEDAPKTIFQYFLDWCDKTLTVN